MAYIITLAAANKALQDAATLEPTETELDHENYRRRRANDRSNATQSIRYLMKKYQPRDDITIGYTGETFEECNTRVLAVIEQPLIALYDTKKSGDI